MIKFVKRNNNTSKATYSFPCYIVWSHPHSFRFNWISKNERE